jgi:hypothetical protein
VKAEVEYAALVSVEVDLVTGEVASVGIRPTRDGDETQSEVTVSLESETDQPEAVLVRAQQKPPPVRRCIRGCASRVPPGGLRDAGIIYVDECFSVIADGEPGQSYADTPIGSYLPSRYEQYYDGRFARDWTTTVAVVGWKLAQAGELTLACVAEELALFALI